MVSAVIVMAIMVVLAAGSIVILCGDPNTSSPIGLASRFLTVWLPKNAHWFLNKIGCGCLFTAFHNLRWWLCLRPNPIVQIMYMVLILGGFGIFLWHAYPFIPNNYMAGYHRYTGLMVMASCLYTFYKASTVDAGSINKENYKEFQVYPLDYIVYGEKMCETCECPKPARSKHCSVCDTCVSKFDHHCIWLNRCVGERNYKWFISFCFLHATTLMYGAVALLCILMTIAQKEALWDATFVNRRTGERTPAGWSIILMYFMHHHTPLMGLLLMCSVMGIVLFGFTGYHLYLASINMTTNETFKWRCVGWDVEDGQAAYDHALKLRARRDEAQKQYKKALVKAKLEGRESEVKPPPKPDERSFAARIDEVLANPRPVMPKFMYPLSLTENLAQVWWPLSLRNLGAKSKDPTAVVAPPKNPKKAAKAAKTAKTAKKPAKATKGE